MKFSFYCIRQSSKLWVLTGLFLIVICLTEAQSTRVKIWKDVDNKNFKHLNSTMTLYEPADSLRKGTTVIICPGGSYHHLGIFHEGFQVGKWFQSQGVTAAVLQYRVSGRGYHHPAMIEDVQRTIQWLKNHSDRYKIDSNRVGVMGFSAGGHLALMAGEFSHTDYLAAAGLPNSVSLRPNFIIAIYPVVSMEDSIGHLWSRTSLLTKEYTLEQQHRFSMDQQVPDDMPPVFLLACQDDDVVDFRNSKAMYQSLSNNHIPCKFVSIQHGGHGFGMFKTKTDETKNWHLILYDWLSQNHFLDKTK